jgi:hypothetical protein
MFKFGTRVTALTAAALASILAFGDASFAADCSTQGFSASTNYAPRQFDAGGRVLDYYRNVRAANSSARRVVISGVCASACTMKLGIRNACVEPDATLLFHQASYNGFRSELGTRIMLYAFPRRIRHWILRSGALDSSSLTELSGREAIALGARSC